jgi:hypothetical protein
VRAPVRTRCPISKVLRSRRGSRARSIGDEVLTGGPEARVVNEVFANMSHETIYRSLYIQARGALKRELLQHLRRTRGMRRSRQHTQKTASHGKITDAISISERPASVEDRAVPGHWEGDLLFGDRSSQIATLVERQTRYVMLVKVDATDTETVVNALIKNARKLSQELYPRTRRCRVEVNDHHECGRRAWSRRRAPHFRLRARATQTGAPTTASSFFSARGSPPLRRSTW